MGQIGACHPSSRQRRIFCLLSDEIVSHVFSILDRLYEHGKAFEGGILLIVIQLVAELAS